jgi:hypothetical protein
MMKNLVEGSPFALFDLKGSLENRQVDPHVDSVSKLRPGVMYKDVDFLNSVGEIRLTNANEVLATLERDVEFLRSLHITDYSLLVGVYDYKGTYMFQFGIIDFLQTFDTSKRIEGGLK